MSALRLSVMLGRGLRLSVSETSCPQGAGRRVIIAAVAHSRRNDREEMRQGHGGEDHQPGLGMGGSKDQGSRRERLNGGTP